MVQNKRMEALIHPASSKPAKKGGWFSLILMTAIWLGLTCFLVMTNFLQKGPGWGKMFLARAKSGLSGGAVSGAPAAWSNVQAGIVGPKPSPTVYIPAAATDTGDYKSVSFETLSNFYYWNPLDGLDGEGPSDKELEKEKAKSKVPDEVLALNGRKVAVVGFMIPVDEDEKFRVKTFVLAKNQMTCCYGATPRPNDWIFVNVPGNQTVDDQMDVPLTVFGTLSVDPALKDPDYPTLYKMTLDKLKAPRKDWF